MLTAIVKTRKFLRQVKPNIVHTHLSEGTSIGLIAAFTLGIKNRIHTRHHAAECHIYYRHAIWYDKFNNFMSKRIVANSNLVAGILINMEKVPAKKVRVIYYGYDLNKFSTNDERISKLKETYKLSGYYPIIGVISRFVHWKGIQDIIPAFESFLKKYPRSKLVLANARGGYHAEILKLLKAHIPEENYVLIEYEKDVFSLYKTFDIFLHVPVNKDVEAFGQTYIESLLMEVPSIFTLSGIANEIVIDKKNAVVVPYHNSNAIYEAMILLMENPDLKNTIARQGKQDILKNFLASQSAKNLDLLYSEL